MNDFLKKIQILNGAQLKWIAMVSMLMDHISKGILLNYQIFFDDTNVLVNILAPIFDVLGRIAFPIFLYLLVEGFIHTRSRQKYFLNLMLFGVLSEIPYDMFESGTYFDWGGQNMFFTLALALVMLCVVEKIQRKMNNKWWSLVGLVVAMAFGFVASLLGLDYHFYGILIPYVFYVFIQTRWVGCFLSYLIVLKELWSCLGFGCIMMYNGQRGHINKWIGYWFYPVHLFIIGCIRMYVMNVR